MRALIRAYLAENFGDDLFVYILCNRYPGTQFYLVGEESKRYIEHCADNLKFVSADSFFSKILNKKHKLKMKLQGKKYQILREEAVLNEMCKLFKHNILVTGSFYIQSPYWDGIIRDKEWYETKPYILGCNFGPYYDKEYYQIYRELFKNAAQVCFREQYSYQLFKNLKNVSWAPDLVFNLDISKYDIIDNDYIIVSVVNLLKDDDMQMKDIQDSYIHFLVDVINKLTVKRKKVVLMSFCCRQGDTKVIDAIMKLVDNRQYVTIYEYKEYGIEKSIELFSKCSGVIATRYHAMILGMLFRKPLVPIVYSEKMLNVLNDMGYSGRVLNVNSLSNEHIENIEDLMFKLQDDVIDRQIERAQLQFEYLDNIFY